MNRVHNPLTVDTYTFTHFVNWFTTFLLKKYFYYCVFYIHLGCELCEPVQKTPVSTMFVDVLVFASVHFSVHSSQTNADITLFNFYIL